MNTVGRFALSALQGHGMTWYCHVLGAPPVAPQSPVKKQNGPLNREMQCT